MAGAAVGRWYGVGSAAATGNAARRALGVLQIRSGGVDAALNLGMSEWDSRIEVMRRALSDAVIPNVDQVRTAGVVVLPGAFISVLLSTGSAVQACAVAVTGALITYGKVVRQSKSLSATTLRPFRYARLTAGWPTTYSATAIQSPDRACRPAVP
jgi:putative ABC transport system permease protein